MQTNPDAEEVKTIGKSLYDGVKIKVDEAREATMLPRYETIVETTKGKTTTYTTSTGDVFARDAAGTYRAKCATATMAMPTSEQIEQAITHIRHEGKSGTERGIFAYVADLFTPGTTYEFVTPNPISKACTDAAIQRK